MMPSALPWQALAVTVPDCKAKVKGKRRRSAVNMAYGLDLTSLQEDEEKYEHYSPLVPDISLAQKAVIHAQMEKSYALARSTKPSASLDMSRGRYKERTQSILKHPIARSPHVAKVLRYLFRSPSNSTRRNRRHHAIMLDEEETALYRTSYDHY